MYYGDLGKRIVAAIIDSVIISAASVLLALLLGPLGIVFSGLVSWLISWLYPVLMEGGGWHATLGKRIMGLYVADESGNGITYTTSILRNIGKILSGVMLGIGYIMGLFNDSKQCLHDMIAKTYVLEGEARAASGRGRNNNGYGAGYQGSNNGYEAMPEIVAVNGPLAGNAYQITEKGIMIGRDSISCNIVLPASQTKVSRNHCFVTFNPISGMFVINDRNSTHGTYLANGSRISYSQPAALKIGGRFYLATPENTFEVR